MRQRELGALAIMMVTVLALGAIIARDLRESAQNAMRLYEHLARSLDLVDELQFRTQEVRRTLLYALHTSDANLQLRYAEQSRTAERDVERLLSSSVQSMNDGSLRARVVGVERAWHEYLEVRDEVIGLILEGSLSEGVLRDERQGTARFSLVHDAIAALKQELESNAAIEATAAKVRADRATTRVLLLVLSGLVVATVAMWLIGRRTVLESLLRIQAHKGSILEAVPNPIISTDKNGLITELNDAAEGVFGVSRSVARGKRIEDVILAPEDQRRLLPDLPPGRSAAAVACPRIEALGRSRDGTAFPMELAAVTHSVGGERIWTVHVSDLTERWRVEEVLRQARDAAEKADEAKGAFLATMSHELRTPLVGVIGAAELLEHTEATPQQRELIAMLRSSASALLGLVSSTLEYSRIEAGLVDLNPAPFSLRSCIEHALDPVTERSADKGLDLGYVIDRSVPASVVADEERVRQVLLNLLSNAVKFTDTGEVAVHVSAQPAEADTLLVTIAVRDTGRGIPASTRPHLFQRFGQVHRDLAARDAGAGLGLAISEHLSRMLGGSLTVESEEHRGATFTFTFSAHVDPGVAGEAVTGALRGVRVLALGAPGIVTDHLAALLGEAGASFVLATDVPAAQDRLRDEPWDAILVDADARGGALYALAVAALDDTTRRGVIGVTRLQAIASQNAAGHSLVKPIKARALCDAVAAAAGVPALQTPTAAARPATALSDSSPSILLVEDNDANRRIIEMMIAELGLRADTARSGREAIDAAGRHHYDVILMDVQMPDIDGLEAARRIRAAERGQAARIVALTANVMEGDRATCREAGMNDYLSKPLRLDSLAAVLLAPPAADPPSINPT